MNNKIQKANNQVPFLRYQEQRQGIVHDLCTQQQQGSGQTLDANPLAGPADLPSPSCHFRKQPTLLGEKQGHLFLVLTSSCYSLSPIKPCLNSSSASCQFLLIEESKDPGWQQLYLGNLIPLSRHAELTGISSAFPSDVISRTRPLHTLVLSLHSTQNAFLLLLCGGNSIPS